MATKPFALKKIKRGEKAPYKDPIRTFVQIRSALAPIVSQHGPIVSQHGPIVPQHGADYRPNSSALTPSNTRRRPRNPTQVKNAAVPLRRCYTLGCVVDASPSALTPVATYVTPISSGFSPGGLVHAPPPPTRMHPSRPSASVEA